MLTVQLFAEVLVNATFVVLLKSSAEFPQCHFCSTSNHLSTSLSLKDIISTRRPTYIYNREKLGPKSSRLSTFSEQRLSQVNLKDGGEQEGGVNTPDWADPMIIAIMTSRRKKRANAEKFRKWRRRPLSKQLFGASFSTHWSVKLCSLVVESCNYDLSLLRGK